MWILMPKSGTRPPHGCTAEDLGATVASAGGAPRAVVISAAMRPTWMKRMMIICKSGLVWECWPKTQIACVICSK